MRNYTQRVPNLSTCGLKLLSLTSLDRVIMVEWYEMQKQSFYTHIYIQKEGAFFAIGQAASILEQSVYGIVDNVHA